MKIIKMTVRRVYGIKLFGKFIKLWIGKDIMNNNTYGWTVVPKMKDCPICWGSGNLFYRKDGIDEGIKNCYFCKGLGKIHRDDNRNPYLADNND